MNDFFCTPSPIAKAMADAVARNDCPVIADFAVGDGGLLSACEARWPDSQYVAFDIQEPLVAELRCTKPTWQTWCCNFLDGAQRDIAITNCGFDSFPLIILNPPFSCRGGKRVSSTLSGMELKTSLAMAFTITALNYLSGDGEMVVLMPVSSLYSEKDEEAWKSVKDSYHVEQIHVFSKDSFPDCSASTEVVSIRPRSRVIQGLNQPIVLDTVSTDPTLSCTVNLVRGNLPMHRVDHTPGSSLPLVHTTCLRSNVVDLGRYRVPAQTNTVRGPVVLIPRVGNPSLGKVAIFYEASPIVLSDCVFGLQAGDVSSCMKICQIIHDNWSEFRGLYRGTGASYTTRRMLSQFFRKHGCALKY